MTREQAINSMISHGFTVEQAGEIIKAVTPQLSSELEKNSKKLEKGTAKNDLGVKNLCELCGNAINCPMLAGVIREECGLYKPTTKNDLEVQKAIEIIKADSLAPYSVEDILKARDLAVEALKQMKTAKNSLSAEEVTAFAEWTAKLTKASEEAYRRGYLDCSEKLRSFQKLHDEERELKDKLNKIDIEDAWKCGFEQGVKYEKLGRTDICPHCGEYIGEEE